jgi:hypothetical protein
MKECKVPWELIYARFLRCATKILASREVRREGERVLGAVISGAVIGVYGFLHVMGGRTPEEAGSLIRAGAVLLFLPDLQKYRRLIIYIN